MGKFEVTKMGERGQVVIPQEFRKQLNLQAGEKFIVVASGDTLLLKRLIAPSEQEFRRMLEKAHIHASRHGLTGADAKAALRKARNEKSRLGH